MSKESIKVLIVDDSIVMLQLLQELFALDASISVVGVAKDAFEARDLIKRINPDVITLDIMMPGMDGLTFLKNLMRLRPLPVVMLSSFTKPNSEIAIKALAEGAVDYLPKPTAKQLKNPTKYAKKLLSAVKNAAKANVKSRISLESSSMISESKLLLSSELLTNEIIAMGASTGGIEAIEILLPQFPKFFPPVLLTQHISKAFSPIFLKRLQRICRLKIKAAENGDIISPGCLYLAVPGRHMVLSKCNNSYCINLIDSQLIYSHKPSVDVLFSSVAEVAGEHSIGILLTGMGKDGAQGMKKMRDAGGKTIAQDQASSVVWGMPSAAINLDAVDYVVPLKQILVTILNILDDKAKSYLHFNAKGSGNA